MDQNKLQITPAILNELEQLALAQNIDFPSQLNYRQIQQTLTLHSLLQYFQQRGISLPFELSFTDEKDPTDKRLRSARR